MPLTGEQRRAVEAPGSAAVVAGAGTGKTHMLVSRYLHHLSADGLSPLAVVAITFTEKAAEELRSRIRRQAGESLPDSEEAEATLAELEAAPIGTIHSLCARICREHPEEADVPPDFGILDDLRGTLWTADRLADLMDELPAEHYDSVPYPLMQTALESFFADPLAAEEALDKGSEGWKELAAAARSGALERFLHNPDLQRYIEILVKYRGGDGDRAEESRASALAALRGLDRSDGDVEQVKTHLTILDGIDLRGGSKKKWGEGELEVVKAALREARDLARAEIKRGLILLEPGPADDLLAEALPALRDAFGRARAFVARAKRRARLLDFSDLEVHALRALEHEDVRSYYRERWRAFLVDEFQDTNPVQAALLQRLTEGAKLTVVGDEKQSIYGFRRADAEVFRRFRARILSDDGSEVVLSTSFRAHMGIIVAVNAVFSPVLGDLRQDLSAHRLDPPHEGPHVRAYAIEAEDKTRKSLLQRAEAALVSRLIAEMLEAGTTVHDGSTGTERPCRPGDFALLSRAWEPLGLYGEALSAAGIPSVHAGGGDLLKTREAKDGLALLRFLVDPEEDDVALVALLRSPFFALDDRLLTEIAGQREEEAVSWWRLVRYASDERPQLAHAVEILEQLLEARRLEPPADLLALADRLTGYTAVVANLPGAERREADWRGFRDLVRDLARGSEDAFAVVRWLRRLLEAGAEVPRPPLEAGDAVTLTTIHGSKGLEWPVVVLPDLDRRVPPRTDAVLLDPELGVGIDPGEDEKPVLHRLISDRKAVLEEAELRRLLYVALTRTADHLILTTTDVDTTRLCGLTLLQPGLELAGVAFTPVPFRPQDARPPELPVPAPEPPPRLLVEPVG